jgi:hypothetical protein
LQIGSPAGFINTETQKEQAATLPTTESVSTPTSRFDSYTFPINHAGIKTFNMEYAAVSLTHDYFLEIERPPPISTRKRGKYPKHPNMDEPKTGDYTSLKYRSQV